MKRTPPELAGYPGCKTTQGIPQWIINRIPPHRVYVEPYLGSGAIWQRFRARRRYRSGSMLAA